MKRLDRSATGSRVAELELTVRGLAQAGAELLAERDRMRSALLLCRATVHAAYEQHPEALEQAWEDVRTLVRAAGVGAVEPVAAGVAS